MSLVWPWPSVPSEAIFPKYSLPFAVKAVLTLLDASPVDLPAVPAGADPEATGALELPVGAVTPLATGAVPVANATVVLVDPPGKTPALALEKGAEGAVYGSISSCLSLS